MALSDVDDVLLVQIARPEMRIVPRGVVDFGSALQ